MTAATSTFEIIVDSHLDDRWSAWLETASLERRDDGTTALTGPFTDQAQLHGLLARIRDLNLPLLTLRTSAPDDLRGTHSRHHAAMPALSEPLRTARLVLRPASETDADATWAYRKLDAVAEWLSELPLSLEEYRRTFVDPDRLAATVMVDLDSMVIGDFMLRIEDAWAQSEVRDQARSRQAELGWVLDPQYTGVGYATEAVSSLMDHCFTQLGVRRVVANCFLANDASWRLMERIGMHREGHAVAESLHRSGHWLDTVTYAMLASEWRSA
jgi:RimJ/RimL family protein N-acetyltransferase